MTEKIKKENIVIVGGGFAGVKAALFLSKYSNFFNITLISETDNLRYYPLLYKFATGANQVLVSIPLTKIFQNKKIKIVHGSIASLDRSTKSIHLVDNQTFNFDKLILALGVVTNYFGIDGIEDYAYSIKSEAEAMKFNRHLHDYLIANHQPDDHYVVIGAGPTGIELAAELPEYLRYLMKIHHLGRHAIKVEIIEALNQLLPRLPKPYAQRVSKKLISIGVSLKLNSKVISQNNSEITVNNQTIKSKTVVWTAGVANHPFYKANNFLITQHGKIACDIFLQAEDNIFIAGDNANTPFSGLAQTALHDGQSIAENIVRNHFGYQMKAYKPKNIITVIPVGPKFSAVLWGKKKFYGFYGSVMRHLADIDGYMNVLPWYSALALWLKYFHRRPQTCPICQSTNGQN